ncbi:MAG: methyltransferase domain-containing protein, partial [Acidimicrobiales bacterium]|nr:methyltransferase domain-containing protein [Acidimicrobiales bacterium]
MSDRRWRDGSEDRIVSVLRAASDRSSASDELAAQIDDWPTRYHFGRARTNLLHPIRLGPGVRVLDVGAGSGVNSRWAAEQGATVVAVEGDALRAEAAALRCAGLDVDVCHGSATDLVDDDGFDVVLCVGVLEYAGDDPDAFLGHLADLVRPGGALVVAIENRFGLAYWLQADEDHLGLPFVGLEGYPTVAATDATAAVRTFSRAELAGHLTVSGLTAQRWYQPYPDYKLPTAVLTDRCFDQPDAVDLVDQLVGPPIDR